MIYVNLRFFFIAPQSHFMLICILLFILDYDVTYYTVNLHTHTHTHTGYSMSTILRSSFFVFNIFVCKLLQLFFNERFFLCEPNKKIKHVLI